ncbi:mechanosensitive ion channel family protein [Ostreiculturibacter nitratireducens]|uniref:mechanosensitive ion channel family protein n=1 Tax=Ostreiculturibacter nitratireducens TaxID=3075226 RepID=UPI0031B5C604
MDPTLVDSAQGIWGQIESFLKSLVLPPRREQIAIIVAIAIVAHGVRFLFAQRIYDWLKAREGWAKWRLRLTLTFQQRTRGIVFVTLAWVAVGVLRQMSPFPSRWLLVEGVATLATAWLVVSLAARIVRNTTLRRIVRWGALTYVTLHFLGLADDIAVFLENLAIEFGDFRLSVLAILKALVVTALLFMAARFLSQNAARRIRENEDMSPSMRVLTVKFLQILLYGSAFFIGLKAVGFDLTGLAVLSGAIGVGLGFGLQKVVSNLVSGMIILLDKSVKPGDVISLGDTFGWINSLGARYVSVVTRDGKEYLIPNEDLITGQVVNWSHSNDFVRLDLFFGTSYDNDPHKVRKIAVEAAMSVPRVLGNKPAVCHVVGFGDSSVDYILRFWIRDPVEGLTNIRGNVYLALWDAFKEHDISIPFPQREIRVLEGSRIETRSAE